jgi:hypothetical protein
LPSTRPEPHVQHPVRFIEHEDLDPGHTGYAYFVSPSRLTRPTGTLHRFAEGRVRVGVTILGYGWLVILLPLGH